MKKQKTWNLIGLILGVVVVIVGIIFLVFPADSYSTSSVKTASFGADFYTYVYDGIRTATSNTATTANNIRELSGKLALYSGFLFIVLGLLIALHYGKLFFTAEPEVTADSSAAGAAAPAGPGSVSPYAVEPTVRHRDE